MDYKLILSIGEPYNQVYSEADIQLGTQIKKSLDKSYDMISITLPLTKISEEFQPFTSATFSISIISSDNQTSFESYDMIIESDNMQEEYIGDQVRYTHQIVLIESTKKLENEMMPNIAFTQPVRVISQEITDTFLDSSEIKYGPETAATAYTTTKYDASYTWFSQWYNGAIAMGISVGAVAQLIWATAPAIWLGSSINPGKSQCEPEVTVNGEVKKDIGEAVTHQWDHGDKIFQAPTNFPRSFYTGGKLPLQTISPIVQATVNPYESAGHSNNWWAYASIIRPTWNPTSVELYLDSNTSGKPNYVINGTDKISYSDAAYKYSYTGFVNPIDIPTSIPSGKYRIVYRYNINSFFRRNVNLNGYVTGFPIQTWGDYRNTYEKQIITNYVLNRNIDTDYGYVYYSDGTKQTMKDYLDKYAYVEFDNVNIVNTADTSSFVVANYTLSDLLTRIENQITISDIKPIQETNITNKGVNGIWDDEGAISESVPYSKTYAVDLSPITKLGRLSLSINFSKVSLVNKPSVTTSIYFIDASDAQHVRSTGKLDPQISILTTKFGNKINVDFSVPADTTRIIFSVRVVSSDTNVTWSFDDVMMSFSAQAAPKYTFSETVKSKASKIICPEFTFDKKTLWEICLEIGEVLNGIPFLTNDNKIDYKFLYDNKEVDTLPEAVSKRSSVNMTNYATKLYTPELKNIIDDNENVLTYPMDGGWTTVRASNYNETQVNRSTSTICIDNENTGIYKLKNLKVKYKYEGNEVISDITKFVLEKKIWDTLDSTIKTTLFNNEAVSDKGLYAYYVQGEKYIYNLAQLPDNGSVIGWKQTNLTIALILAKAFGHDILKLSKNIFDYQFRVEYIPYYSRLNISYQSNLNSVYNQATTNFNQSSNNVSSDAYGRYSENTLSKLGAAEKSIQYISDSDIDIGNKVPVDNKNYYANVKNTVLGNVDMTSQLDLTKDNYKQNDRIAVSREYRQYNIDSSNLVRKTLSKPYSVIISVGIPAILSTSSPYVSELTTYNKSTLSSSIYCILKPTKYFVDKISSAHVIVENYDGSRLKYKQYTADPSSVSPKILPVNTSCIANTITMEWDMYDNFSAGRKATEMENADSKSWIESRVNDINNLLSSKGLTEGSFGVRIQNDCRYCDDNGNAPRIRTTFFSLMNNLEVLNEDISDSIPDVTIEDISPISRNRISLDFMAYKDSREKLSCQINYTAQTYDKDIIIKDLMKNNPLYRNIEETPIWYGYTDRNAPSINSNKMNIDPSNALTTVSVSNFSGNAEPYVRDTIGNNTTNDYIGYALCYKDGTILLNITKPIHAGDTVKIYFCTFNDILNYSDIQHPSNTVLKIRANKARPDLSFLEVVPKVYLKDNKLYLDNSGYTYSGYTVDMAIRHNSYPRGIHQGYKGRAYAKQRPGDLLIYGNNWGDNSGNYMFNTIFCDESTGEIYYLYNGVRHNIMEYLSARKLSKLDSRGKYHLPKGISYAFRLSYGDMHTKDSNFLTGLLKDSTIPDSFIV